MMIKIADEIADTLAAGGPVVALESTIIAHGMPYPRNVETALAVEAAVRAGGAAPATVAILDGQLRVGLSPHEIEAFGQPGAEVAKASRRDLAVLLAQGRSGATTVSATMLIAHRAGIRIFATGGIGGVHREAPQTFDVSADLTELAQTPVAVVTAGAKAILDLALTREYLETQGVPVIGFGVDAFPAFYTPHSGLTVDYRLDTPTEIARALQLHWQLGLGGVVVANPIPDEYALDKNRVDQAIAVALSEAAQQGITGKAITPFLLQRLAQLTGGDSLEANIGLVLNNARLGAALAVAYCKIA